MNTTHLETTNIRLTPQNREDVLAEIAQMPEEERVHLSTSWLALVDGSGDINPWIHGFKLTLRTNGTTIGRCGFKGPPDADGAVEIAYGVDPEHQGKGYATEAAIALTRFAFSDARVRIVRAHTLPEANASTRVLTKSGFEKIGEVLDPEDGPVWRWEKRNDQN
ncbi:MAG: GNAT family N-acetyltransferase [Verrucomicrobia bacterium]|nr:GNAT family N-acetyltransferase [Verrucomicrobiota bacterium]